MHKRTLIAAILSAAILSGCAEEEPAAPAINIITPTETTVTSTETVTTMPETEPPPPPDRKITMTALGDNLIHSSIYKQANRRSEDGSGYDFEYAYAGAADLLDTSDITILNQETLICGNEYAPDTYPTFNSPEELGFYMADLGVDVFTIANNHTLDKGTDGLFDCLSYYDRNNFTRVGAYFDEADRSNIRVIEKNGVKVSFLCYTESLNGLSLPEGSPLQIGMYDKDVIAGEIKKAKEISDICVLSLHWGLENSDKTQDYQREAAYFFGECGADVIIGNHPHVLREIEIFQNPDGRETICAYSLGNLISAQSVGKNLIGGVLDFEITLPSDNSPSKITSAAFTPVITHYDKGYSDVRLYKLSDYTPELANAHGVRSNSTFSYDYIIEYLDKQGLDDFGR